jgi:hypothetical protein
VTSASPLTRYCSASAARSRNRPRRWKQTACDLLQVEDLFRRAKAIIRTRPIYHSSDAAIRGHVFYSFLALMLQKELADLCQCHGLVIEWADLLRDLDRLQEATIDKDGKRISTRTAIAGQVGSVFQATGIALPPNLHEPAA